MNSTPPKGTCDWQVKPKPSFKGLSCYVLPGAMYGNCVVLMAEYGFQSAEKPEDADLVVFIGGSDVSPSFYNQEAVAAHGVSPHRDNYEKTVYEMCKRRAIPMFGICRGAQFLHVMNGGQLWQDVNNHAGPSHNIIDLDEDARIRTTSLHHQMIISNDRLRIVAVTEDQVATSFKNANNCITLDKDDHELEVEAGIYDDTNCFFTQGHPEIGEEQYRNWTMYRLREFMFEDVDVNYPQVVEGQIG